MSYHPPPLTYQIEDACDYGDPTGVPSPPLVADGPPRARTGQRRPLLWALVAVLAVGGLGGLGVGAYHHLVEPEGDRDNPRQAAVRKTWMIAGYTVGGVLCVAAYAVYFYLKFRR